MRKVVLLVVAGVVLVGLGVGVWYIDRAAPVATGYAAKTVCSGYFVSGRDVADVEGDLPANPLTPLLSTAEDPSNGSVRATLLGVWSSTAWFTSGHGCTLASERPEVVHGSPLPEPASDTPWPAGDGVELGSAGLDEDVLAAPDALVAAFDAAFSEDDVEEGSERGTRAVVVAHRGRIVAERYADGFNAGTPLLGWSMSKSLANVLVGRLVGAGSLELDQSSLLAGWAADERSEITLEQLLQMRSGLAFDEVYEIGTDATEMLYTPGSVTALPASEPLVAAPGSRWSYSSGTTNVLCEVARAALGVDGPDMLTAQVFKPLGMTSAVMEPDAVGLPVCSSFTYATGRDWAKLGQLFLDDGLVDGERFLPEDWVEFSTTPVELATAEPYGAQWWLNEGPSGELRMPSVPADAYWASGNEGQQVVVIPSADLVVVRLGLSRGFDGIDWGLEPLLGGVLEGVGAGR